MPVAAGDPGYGERGRLAGLIRSTGALRRSEAGFELSSGRRSEYYFDLRRLAGDPEGLQVAAGILYGMIRGIPGVRSVGGMESGSIPLAAAVSLFSRIGTGRDPNGPALSSFYVRKAPKDHGTGGTVEGVLAGRAVILDDVITTGASAVKAADAVRWEGHRCASIMCVVFRGDGGDRDVVREAAPLRYVFEEADLLPGP